MDKPVPGSTKAELLRCMHAGRQDVETMVRRADPALIVRESTVADWSVKDIVAHLASWQRFQLTWMDAETRGIMPDLPMSRMSQADVDRLNAQNYAADKHKPLEAVFTEFQHSFAALVAKAEELPEEVLLDGQRFAWTCGKAPWQLFACNTYSHYAEHLDQLRQAGEAEG